MPLREYPTAKSQHDDCPVGTLYLHFDVNHKTRIKNEETDK